MNQSLRLYCLLLFVCLGGVGVVSAQTITTGTSSATSVCAGGTITVPFSTSGSFGSKNQFKLQLAPASGAFVDIGTGIGSPITATLPASAIGSDYQVRVVSTSPAVNGSISTTTLTINEIADAPTVVSTVTYCQGATVADLSATPSNGGTLQWYTSATGGTASATAPTPGTAVGSTTYYVSQVAGGCESPRAAITVTITAKPDAPGTSAITYCQDAPATPLTAAPADGGTLNWYGTSATGGTASATAPTPPTSTTGTTTYYVSQTINGCESPRAALVVTVRAQPAAPTAVTSFSYCQNQPATPLTATGQNLKWYDAANGGNEVANVPNTQTAGTFDYYVSQTVGGCESPRTRITVEVKAVPPAPTVGPVSYCAGSTASPLSAVATSGGTLRWYGLNGAVLAGPPTPLTNATGVTSYSVSQTVGASCESPKAVIQVTINAIPSAPVASSAVAFCQNETAKPLTATGENLKWYTTPTGGAGENSITPNTTTAGTKTYYVSQTVNGCEGPRTGVTVTIRALPAAPTVGNTALSYCVGESIPSLTATAATGATLVWTGPGVTNSATAPKPSSTTSGVFTYTVSQKVGDCVSESVEITVTIKEKPAAPVTQNVAACVGTPVLDLEKNVTVPTSATLTWYTAATGGTALPGTPTPVVSTAGTTRYFVTQTVNGCTSDRAQLNVVVNPLPAKPTIAKAGPYCEQASASTLNAQGTGTIKWYGPNGRTPLQAAPKPSTTKAGSLYYLATQTVNGCESLVDSIVIVVKPKPAKPITADSTLEFCQNTKAPVLAATPIAGAKLNWFTFTSDSTATVPVIPNREAKTYTYTVSQTLNGCTSDKTEINVTVNPTPVAPQITIERPVVCQKEAPIALTASGQSLKWYAKDSITVVPNTVQNTDNAGTFVYFVSQTLKACESPKTRTELRVKPLPGAPQISTPAEVCQDAPAQMLQARGENVKWFDRNDDLLGGAPTPGTNVDQEITYTYKTTQTVDGCESDKLTVNYKVVVTPKPNVTTPVAYCQNAPAKPLEATGQNLKWINPYGGESATAPTPPTTNISTRPEGDSYYVTQKVGSCESRRAEIRLIVNAPPTAKIEGAATVNLGKTVPVTISFTSVPPFSYTLSDGTSGTATTTQKEIELLPTKKTTIYRVTNVTNSCGAGTPVGTFTVNAVIPTVTTNPLSVTTVCVGTAVQIPFATAGQFMEGNRFNVEMALASDTAFTNKIAIAADAMQSPITARIPTTLAQGLYIIRVVATNPRVPVPGSKSPTILNIRALPTATLTGTKDIYDNESTPLSFALTGDAPWTLEYTDNTKTTKVTTSTNPHVITVTPVQSTTYTVTAVSNTCGTGKATGTATIRVLPVLGLEPDPLTTAVKVFPVPTEHILTVDIDLPLQKNPARLQLTDENGRVMHQLTTRQRQTRFDLSHRSPGYYFLHIQIGDRKTVRKIMKR
ncbi:Ig-like domain-containing protein [Larkinella arboricola]